MRNALRPQHLYIIEAAFIGTFFVQALRFLVGMVYSRVAGASIVNALNAATLPIPDPEIIDPATVGNEITFIIVVTALPLFTLILGRLRWFGFVAVILVAAGRTLMNVDLSGSFTVTMAAALAVGGGLVYVAQVVRFRAQILPYMFIVSLSIDQLYRAVGNTLDPSWFPDSIVRIADTEVRYFAVQVALSVIVIGLSLLTIIWQRRAKQTIDESTALSQDFGILPFWGGIGFGALLFLELSLLSLPNALARRTGSDYATFVPLVLLATALPLIPWVRLRAQGVIGLFDRSARGWVWALIAGLLVVFGTRFHGAASGVALLIAQFIISLLWWWLARPRAANDRNFTGLWLLLTSIVFALLIAGDVLTYEYAFVRNFREDLDFLNEIVLPLLRGFRGLGLAIILFAIFLAALPMIQARRRIPWGGGTFSQTISALVFIAVLAVSTALAARPPLVQGQPNPDSIRVGTYNIHAGYDEFFTFDLEAISQAIQQSGAQIILLQEVEAGRLTSFGVDQPLWLARQLGMDTRFFPTNEGLQGLATLSALPIVEDGGELLTSERNQTGVQRVRIQPDQRDLLVYNTWLGLLVEATNDRPLSDQEQDQQRQLSEIFGIIEADHALSGGDLGRTIVGGTFNNIPDSPLIAQMRSAGFNDPFDGTPLDLSATLRRTNRRARIDYLWVHALLSIGAGVMDSDASDHRMAVTEIQLARRVE